MQHFNSQAAFKSHLLAGVAPRFAFKNDGASLATIQGLIEASNGVFEEFKAANDERLKQLEKTGSEDVVTAEKVEKINATITALETAISEQSQALARASLGAGGEAGDPDKAAHAKAFNKFFRRGIDDGLRELEVNAALSSDSDPDGGFTVPEQMESTIDRVLGTVSAMRGMARVIPIGAATYKKLVNVGGASSGWVGERGSRSETSTPELRAIVINSQELYAEPAATQTMLDDSFMDIEGWLADEVSIEFAEQEGAAFITGNGINKPKGILAYDTVANGSYAFGKVGLINSGASGAFPYLSGSTIGHDANTLIDLVHALKQGYRNNANFLMNDTALGSVRKLKDKDGNYVYQASLREGSPETLLGKPVQTDDNMPDISANSLSIAFGDFQRAYTITDRVGVRVLRDPFTNKPYVLFYTTKRVGGGITNFEALKLMKFAA